MRSIAAPMRYALLSLSFVLLVIFVATFNPEVNRWRVTFAWLGALGAWVASIWMHEPRAPAAHFQRRYLWAFGLFAAIFAALWLPFYDNWRWCEAGDSFPWFWMPAAAAKSGLPKSILSVRGIWEYMTYTSVIVDNALMFVFEPTFFWHRVSKLVLSVLSLAAIYTYFSLILEFPWALAVVSVTAATFHWQIFSRISFNHIDSFIFAYLALAAAILVVRDPARIRRWMALGVVAGLSLFFTQTAWTEVAACGLVLGVWALYRRAFVPLTACGLSFVIAGFPVLLQLPDVLHAAAQQGRTLWDSEYLWRIFRTIFFLPAGGGLQTVVWNGHFAPWPCGPLYLSGLVIAALSGVPAIRRRLRLSPAAAGLFLLFFVEIILMTLTNNGYNNPSAKRTYHLIPLQAFFILLAPYTLAQAVRRSVPAARAVTAAAFVGIGLYALATASLFVVPERFDFPGNIFDGIVQMRQRFPDRQVLVFAPQANIKADVDDPTTILNHAYHVAESVSVIQAIDPALVDAACGARNILCFLPTPENTELFDKATASRAMKKVTVFTNPETRCAECG